MSKVITIRLEVRDNEDTDWMKEKLRALIIDNDSDARVHAERFVIAFEPQVIWADHEIIVWSLLVHNEDEGGDAGIHKYLEEDPSQAHVSAVDFATNYLIWAQGTDWKSRPEALDWLESFRSE
jgi:hypothetical protein